MKALLILLLLRVAAVPSDVPESEFIAPQAIRDSKSDVTYYLESDHRHVAAIAPDGRILWCREVLKPEETMRYHHYISSIESKPGDNFISVGIWVGGFTSARIDKKTGAITWSREVS